MKKYKTKLPQEAYDKYVAPLRQREKDIKIARRKDWWSKNIFNIISTIIAVAALIISLVK